MLSLERINVPANPENLAYFWIFLLHNEKPLSKKYRALT